MPAQINACPVSGEIQMAVINDVVTSVKIRQIGPSQDNVKALCFPLSSRVDRKAW